MTVIVHGGTAASRSIDYPERREVTRQFRAPVFDHTREEFQTRLYLATRYRERSEVARARLSTVHRIFVGGAVGSPARLLLNAFDAQNRAVLGLEGL